MQATWTLAGLWLLQTAVGGSLVLLLGLGWMRFVRQPARRQRLGELSLLAALLAALVAVGPAWLTLPWSPFGKENAVQFEALPERPRFAMAGDQEPDFDLIASQVAWEAEPL